MRSLALIVLCVFTFSALAHVNLVHSEPHLGCKHALKEENPGLLLVDEQPLIGEDRVLQTSFPKIRITADYTNLISGTDEFKAYVRNELLPPVLDYFQAALAVKQPLITPLKIPTSISQMCDQPTPQTLYKGVNTDFYVLVSSSTDSGSNWVASASSCFLSSVTKRPLVAQMLFNMYYTKSANGDPLIHEKNMYLTMHELIHAFGFSGSSFKNYIDVLGNTLTGHLKSAVLEGVTRTVLDLEPLTTRLRNHYGCPSIPGAFLENDGGAGTAGSHFERRHFLYEAMTSGVIQGLRLSEFSLAVLEGSGWYMPNYTYADTFTVGQGEGCSFLSTSCSSSSILNYDEFCSGSGRGCAIVGVSGGVCSSDSRSDGCSYYIPVTDYSCENLDAADNARFPKTEVFGRGSGSRCFEGNLTSSTRSSQTTFCFTYTCNGTGLTTTLDVNIGTVKATCKAKGPISVKNYNGQINCPDPLTFCNTIGKKACPRNCMGRGTCLNGVCKCNSGYTGIDCALNA